MPVPKVCSHERNGDQKEPILEVLPEFLGATDLRKLERREKLVYVMLPWEIIELYKEVSIV